MKTDWEAIARQLWSDREVCGGLLPSVAQERWDKIVSIHTHRDESDLPRNEWRAVSFRGESPALIFFDGKSKVTKTYSLNGERMFEGWYEARKLNLEIGPEITPPEEKGGIE